MNKQRISNGCVFSMSKCWRHCRKEAWIGQCGCQRDRPVTVLPSGEIQATGALCHLNMEQCFINSHITHLSQGMCSIATTHQPLLLQKHRTSTGSRTGRKRWGRTMEQWRSPVHANVSLYPPQHPAWTQRALPHSICSAAVSSAPSLTPSPLPPCSKGSQQTENQAGRFYVEPMLSNCVKALNY